MSICEYKKFDLNFVKINIENFSVVLCDLGASIYSIVFDGKYMTQSLVNEEDFKQKSLYYGKTLGRSGNRIPGNIIDIIGKKFQLENNEGPNTLHGGKSSLSYQHFDYQIKEYKNKYVVAFNYLSPNLQSGFPGNLNVQVTYTISKKTPSIRCDYYATTDEPTICNLTNHTFFTMSVKNLDSCELKIKSSNYLLTGENDLLPIKKMPVFKELDFRKYKPILEDLNNPLINMGKARGYDHNFYFDKLDSKHAQASYRSKNYQMDIITDFECLQIYSDNYLDTFECHELNIGTNKSLAIEPQDDFLNRKILYPNDTYNHFFKLIFKKRK